MEQRRRNQAKCGLLPNTHTSLSVSFSVSVSVSLLLSCGCGSGALCLGPACDSDGMHRWAGFGAAAAAVPVSLRLPRSSCSFGRGDGAMSAWPVCEIRKQRQQAPASLVSPGRVRNEDTLKVQQEIHIVPEAQSFQHLE